MMIPIAIFVTIGIAAMFIVPILFFYPLYINFVTKRPVSIFWMLFNEPLAIVLVGEMFLCIALWTTAFYLFVYKRAKGGRH